MIPENKMCGICGIEKPKESFGIRIKPNGYSWLRKECKGCQEEARRIRYNTIPEIRERILSANKLYSDKHKEKRRKYFKEYDANRKESVSKRGKTKYANNKDKTKADRKEYYKKNRDRQIAAVETYTINNLPVVRERQRKRHSIRIKEDVGYKLLKSLRSRLNSAIKSGGIKCFKTKELVGCDIDFLKKYLESLFLHGMSWENYGFYGWHIDHIKPCSSFDMSNPEDQKICFHYTNLQPLWWLDNIKKSNKAA